MSDVLDRVCEAGADLLRRVDAVLAAQGLPAGHPAVTLVRRLGALPAGVLDAVSAWRPAPVRAAAGDLRRLAEGYERQRDLLTPPARWAGAAGEGFAAHHAALVDFLGQTGAPDEASLVGRVRATAAYLDDVAEWLERSRRDMALAVADAIGSAEAVRLHEAGDVAAAAAIAARILAVAAEAESGGDEVARRWAGRLDEVTYRPPAPAATPVDQTRLAF
ncbi:hypothetical protein ACNTMW_27630 [Planosporangium sp. 12N6]|uniref:hypothetical protein n=1 Tax=Planosporangium spinosum TaxID=3402278 RepID=UPI003CF30990